MIIQNVWLPQIRLTTILLRVAMQQVGRMVNVG